MRRPAQWRQGSARALSGRVGGRPSAVAATSLLPPRHALYERLAHVIEGTGFRSVTEFCVYVLRDLVATHDRGAADDGMTDDEVNAVRRRLRSLGYLDT